MTTTAPHLSPLPRLNALTLGVLAMLAGLSCASAQTTVPLDGANGANAALVTAANSVVIAGQRSSLRNAIAAQEKADIS